MKNYLNPTTGKKYHYYDPNGKGITDTLKWGKMFEDKKERIVKQETTCFGLFYVSTVWLGLDHSFLPNQPPLIYETMVFCRFKLPRIVHYLHSVKNYHGVMKSKDKKLKEIYEAPWMKPSLLNKCGELDMERYTTRKQAIFGHNATIDYWNNPWFAFKHVFKHLFGKW